MFYPTISFSGCTNFSHEVWGFIYGSTSEVYKDVIQLSFKNEKEPKQKYGVKKCNNKLELIAIKFQNLMLL